MWGAAWGACAASHLASPVPPLPAPPSPAAVINESGLLAIRATSPGAPFPQPFTALLDCGGARALAAPPAHVAVSAPPACQLRRFSTARAAQLRFAHPPSPAPPPPPP